MHRTTVVTSLLLLGCVALTEQVAAQSTPSSRVPERVCLAENYTSTSSSCTLPVGIPAGHGVVVFGTVPSTSGADMSKALQDSEGNVYTQLESQVYSGNAIGTIYLWFSRVSTALVAGDTLTLAPLPALESWDFSVYDVGPVQANAADVGVAFSNSSVGVAGLINPATGVPGWWTGQTASTTGTQDMCMAGMTVNSMGGASTPAPMTTFTIDNNFVGLDIVDFHALGAPTSTSPNYSGGSLMMMYVEAPTGTAVQSHVVTSDVDDQAASVMYCLKEDTGAVSSVPYFTGNYCTGTSGCTLNNVEAGDMLVISTHTLDSAPPASPASVTDSLGETAVFDMSNAAADLGTWHISPVLNAGSHAITVNNFGSSGLLVSVIEIAGQGSGNPVEVVAQNLLNSASLGTVNITTITSNDLVYAWGRGASGSDEGDGYTAARVAPTAEYAVVPAPSTQTTTILPRGTLPESDVGLQAMAIRPAGSTQPAASVPRFTGNYCLASGASTCTINNVSAGDMLVISLYLGVGGSSDEPVLVDSQSGETITVDRQNDFDGTESLATWHIAQVVNAGTHTFSITGVTIQSPDMAVSEFSGQNPANPIDVAPVGSTGSGTLASTSLQTVSGNDLIYVWCSGPYGSGTGDGFAAIGMGPTAEYRMAAPSPGTETATCPMPSSGPWTIQEVAIKGTIISKNGAPLVSIAVSPADVSVPKGETQQFTATGTFSDESTANVTNEVVWSSSNLSVATISSTGLATAVATGSDTVQASSGSINGSTGLTVTPPVLVSIAVSPTNSSISQGGTQQFTATGTYSDGSTQNLTASVIWTSSNTAVATITGGGLATGVAPGSVTIQAITGSISGSTSLTISPVLVSIAVTPTNSSIPQGGTQQFTATGTYSDNSTQNLTASVTWTSSNTAVATITGGGLATGVAPGSVTIQATAGSIGGSTSLSITAVVLVSIAVTPTNASVFVSGTQQFTATGTYSDSSTQNLTASVTWTSSNTAVATINSAGLATGVATGSSNIQATLGSISSSVTLTVTTTFPGFAYDMWVDFEQCAIGAAPTTSCLASSTHGTAGTWDVSAMAGLISVQSAAADPDPSDGSNATRGMAYNLAEGGEGYISWALPSPQNSLSFGLWYKTGQPAAYAEGPHFITLFNNAYGPMLRLSDDRNSGDNSRDIRVSPLDAAVEGISDNTWYWVTMKFVQNGVGSFSVYDTSLNLVGTVNFTDTTSVPAQFILLGNTSATPGESGETNYFDNLVINYTTAPFPLVPPKVSGPAVMQTPAPGSTLTGSSATFTWSAGSGATGYWVDIGNVAGGNNYYSSGSLGTLLTATVNGLPTNGTPVYVTLYSLIGGVWTPNAYTYTAYNASAAAGILTTPTPGLSTVLPGSTVTFDWTAGAGASAYWMDIGSSAGGNNYYSSGSLGNVLTVIVNGLPTNGSTIYVTLYSLIGSQWVGNPYTYTAFNAASSLAVMQTPTPGTQLSTNAVTFTWSADANATAYWLDIGSVAGGGDVYSSGNLGNVVTTTDFNVPANGSKLYVTLYSLVGGQWLSTSCTYLAAPGAVMQTPVPGTTLSGSQVTFNWLAGTGAIGYAMTVGSTYGGNDIDQLTNLTGLPTTVNNLPANGSTIYVTLYSQYGAQVLHSYYSYVSGP